MANVTEEQTMPITPISPVSEPLLMRSDREVNNTINSLDSETLSNSENCSDIELDNIKNNLKIMMPKNNI